MPFPDAAGEWLSKGRRFAKGDRVLFQIPGRKAASFGCTMVAQPFLCNFGGISGRRAGKIPHPFVGVCLERNCKSFRGRRALGGSRRFFDGWRRDRGRLREQWPPGHPHLEYGHVSAATLLP